MASKTFELGFDKVEHRTNKLEICFRSVPKPGRSRSEVSWRLASQPGATPSPLSSECARGRLLEGVETADERGQTDCSSYTRVMTAHRASTADRAYFQRIARQNPSLSQDAPPTSLAEMFDRLEQIVHTLGALAESGIAGSGDGDLASHLAFLERSKEIRHRAAEHTKIAR